jgi:hypothetical protein
LPARNTDRDEFEYVVDTAGMAIEPVPGCAVYAAAIT